MPGPLKRASLVRLLASLCTPPSRASSYPVQTGFPTSLADLVVRNHGRLRKTRKPRRPADLAPYPVVNADELPLRPSAPLAPVASPVELAGELALPPPPTQPLSPVAMQQPDAPAIFRLGPELLAIGVAVALVLLAVWSEGTVAALTVVALLLLWIESASCWRQPQPRPAEAEALPDTCVSAIREAEVSPRRPSSSDSGDSSSPRTTERRVPMAAGSDEPTTPKRKGNKRSLRKLIPKKLQKKPKSKDSWSSCDGEANHPETAAGDTDPVRKTESLVPFSAEPSPSESSIEWSSSSVESAVVAVVDRRGPSVKFPLSVFVPVILAGLAAGKLPATALAVLCVALFSAAVQRL